MTGPLVECVPNVSEGRDATVLAAIISAVTAVPGVLLLDVHSDRAHHRSVLTFAGPPERVLDAAFALVRVAAARIDLNHHGGVHPRIGAADVVPFVPLTGTTMAQCVTLANRLAERIGRELAIPVFLYGEAASAPERRRLASFRRGGFETLRERLPGDGSLTPDAGPPRCHPTAGATAVGARPFLVAYNVDLATDDLDAAQRIAAAIRESSGGLPGVQALGFPIDEGVQVSTNLLDLEAVTPARIFAAVRARAEEMGLAVRRSEVVGLAPTRAFEGVTATDLLLEGPLERYLIEPRLRPFGLGSWLDAVAAPTAAPGGGAAAAAVAATAAALVTMVAGITARKDEPNADRWHAMVHRGEELQERLMRLSEEDAEAVRSGDADRALSVPLSTAEAAAAVAALAVEATADGFAPARSDAAVALALARAALRGAAGTVEVNVAGLGDEATAARTRIAQLRSEAGA